MYGHVLQRFLGPKTAKFGPEQGCAGSMTRSTSWYSAFPRCDLGEQLYYGVLKYLEFDSDFSFNIWYVPGPVQASAFLALLGTGPLAGWIWGFDSSDCAHLKRPSNGAHTL